MGKRNIILITLDSVRADHCSFMGYHRETTPTMDKMARKGLYFENAIASGPGTPISLTGIFVREYANTSGTNPYLWRNIFKRKKTLAQILSDKGYITGAFNPNSFVSSYFGFNRGFQYFNDFIFVRKGTFNRIYNKIFDKIAKSEKVGIFTVFRNVKNLIFKEEIFKSWESFYHDVLKWISNISEPFFLWILIIDTHHPYLAPRKYRKWSNLIDMWRYNYKLQKYNWRPNFTEKEKQKLINAYDDSIYYADRFIETLWRDTNDYDPIFVVHSDHGEAFGEHDNLYGHGPYLYEEFIRVPLVLYGADIKGKIAVPTSLIDLSQIILDVGLGRNLIVEELLNCEKDRYVISKIFDDRVSKWRMAVRTSEWKYIIGQKPSGELYNLISDPKENNNLVNINEDVVKDLKLILKKHLRHTSELSNIRNILSRKF